MNDLDFFKKIPLEKKIKMCVCVWGQVVIIVVTKLQNQFVNSWKEGKNQSCTFDLIVLILY